MKKTVVISEVYPNTKNRYWLLTVKRGDKVIDTKQSKDLGYINQYANAEHCIFDDEPKHPKFIYVGSGDNNLY